VRREEAIERQIAGRGDQDRQSSGEQYACQRAARQTPTAGHPPAGDPQRAQAQTDVQHPEREPSRCIQPVARLRLDQREQHDQQQPGRADQLPDRQQVEHRAVGLQGRSARAVDHPESCPRGAARTD